jgi:hypothetical protein
MGKIPMPYKLRHKWRNGATHVIFEPLDLESKLAAIVPRRDYDYTSI